MRKIVVNPEFQSQRLSEYLHTLSETFKADRNVIYTGRNTVYAVNLGGEEFIVKEFRRLSFFRSILNIGRLSKGAKAYKFGLLFIKRGINTPTPVAYVDIYTGLLLRQSFFISLPVYAPNLVSLRKPNFDIHETTLLTQFIKLIQQRGILHGDLNLTNILLSDSSTSEPLHRYTLIDTNRSYIHNPEKSIPIQVLVANMVRITHRRDLLRAILRIYNHPNPQFTRLIFRRLFRIEARKRILHALFPHQ